MAAYLLIFGQGRVNHCNRILNALIHPMRTARMRRLLPAGSKKKRKSWGISLIVLHVSIPASESLTSFSHGGPFFLSTVHSNESGEVPFPWSRRTKEKTEHNGQVWDRRRCCCPVLRTTEAEEQHMIFFLPFQFFRHCFLTRHKMQHDAVGTFLQLLGLCFGVF